MSLPEGTATVSIDNFINAMKIKEEEINSNALPTKHHSEILERFKYKVGRIKASKAKRVYTPYWSLLRKPDPCVKSVVLLIMDYDNPTAALKRDLFMEIHAKQKCQLLQSRSCK